MGRWPGTMICHSLILGFWIVFMLVWALSAVAAKRTIDKRAWRRGGARRLGIIVLVLLALRVPALRRDLRNAGLFAANTGMIAGVAGVVLCGLGIGLAIWARFYLGRNWGRPMSRKANPELVTNGPYAFIRHPIYAGVLLAMLGSAIGESVFWLLLLVLCGPYFVHSARQEEKLMRKQFPGQYPAYMRRTKMLLPFVF